VLGWQTIRFMRAVGNRGTPPASASWRLLSAIVRMWRRHAEYALWGQMKHLRLRRLFAEDGKTFIVALDRSRAVYTPALSDPRRVVADCREVGVDAVIVPLGTLAAVVRDVGSIGVILSVREAPGGVPSLIDTAVRWGVDALKFEAFPGGPSESLTVPVLESLGRACDAAGLPLMAEMVPHSFEAVDKHTVSAVASAARIAMECGADLVKVPPPADGDLQEVVEHSCVPVVALGGPSRTAQDFLHSARQIMSTGAAGLAVGRNVIEAADRKAAAAGIAAVIHGGTR
jgi:DhnA family fructose-bisphosphate aldolase class Ia